MFVPESECKSKAFIRNDQGKTGKNFRKMKNTLLLKTTNRRNILHTKEKEKYEVQRKKETRKRKKNAGHTEKKLAVRPAKHNKKTTMHATSRHVISRVVIIYRSRYDLGQHQVLLYRSLLYIDYI